MKKFLLKNKFIILVIAMLIVLLVIFVCLFKNDKVELSIEERKIERIRKYDRDIYNQYKFKKIDGIVKGIDVSSWQGEINFAKVKNSGIDFVMIRCGFRNLTNEDILEDKKFKYNVSEANKYNIPVGIYFYSTAKNELEVMEEASFVLNLVKDYEITYPIVYDFETFNEKRTKNVSIATINKNAKLFLEYIEEHGYEGMLYANYTALSKYWNIDDFDCYSLWFAHYINNSTYDGKYAMWQYSDRGKIDGIVGNVDLNEAYFYYEELE